LTVIHHSAARRRTRTLLGGTIALACVQAALAQTPTAPAAQPPPLTATFNRTLIFLDPAHGGQDSGAHLNGQILEKDVTLALAIRLRTLLSEHGFSVLSSRQNDEPNPAAPLTLDDRAGIANHARPVACIVVHATASGRGVYLYTSALMPPDPEPRALLWDSAQGPWVPQSLRLANELGTALSRTHVPLVLGRVALRPLDNLTCPAVALEIAPLPVDGSDPTPVTDPAYQQRVAEAVANALIFWRSHADPTAKPAPSVAPASTPNTPTPIPPAAPTPKPPASATPAAARSTPPAPQPAPVIRIMPSPSPAVNPGTDATTTGVSNPSPDPQP